MAAQSLRPSSSVSRPVSDFDSGINTSVAWTEHLERENFSDEEPNDDDESRPGRAARCLYDFEGKAEFRELTVEAGDEINVVKELLADGWSLVKNVAGEVGLLPRTYYTFTSDFAVSLDLQTLSRRRQASTDTLTPSGSKPSGLPITPQQTGEWFPSFRQSLLGMKSLNRFSSFVASGAEEWVLKGNATDTIITTPPTHHKQETTVDSDEDEENEFGSRLSRLGMGEADQHFVDAGPAWKTKIPPFSILVHSPSKRASTLSGAFTVYSITSLFHPSRVLEDEDHNAATPLGSPTRITVYRRFSHFVMLQTCLSRRLPGIALPPLPEKQYAGRFSEDFVEARRGDLERYLGRVVRHPIARYAEVVTFFLGCESDTEWKRLIPKHLTMPPAGPSFYARVYHPAFNLDSDEAAEEVERFDTHTKAVGKGVQGLRNIFGQVREARVEMSKAERLLSYSLLSLITSKPLAAASTTGVTEEDNDFNVKGKGLLNEEGAWCWREGCKDCLKLTKAIQKTSEMLQNVGDLYEDHARRTQLATHEALKGVAHPSSLYQAVVDTHRSTISRHRDATRDTRLDEDMAARCETVLNTTMAEMETYHTQRREDFETLIKEHLDGDIAFYEQVLYRFRAARREFNPQEYNQLGQSARQPSIYERELEHPRLTVAPLLQPCPHVFDAAPMRPVSVAINEGVARLPDFVNRTVRLACKIVQFLGETAVVEASDGGQIKIVWHRDSYISSKFVEIIGRVTSINPPTINMLAYIDLGDKLDMKLVNDTIELMHVHKLFG